MGFGECVKKGWAAFVSCMSGEDTTPPEPEKPPVAKADAKEEKAPDTARSQQMPAAAVAKGDAAPLVKEEKPKEPYRDPAPEPPKPEWEELCVKGTNRFMCRVVKRGDITLEQFQSVRSKAQRRAIRHFDGKEVRHRVSRKNAEEIEFAFYRRSGKGPVKLVVRKEAIEPNVAQVGTA